MNRNECENRVKAGHLGHWASNTDHLSTVQYTYPKFRVDTTYTSPLVVRTPVLLGTVHLNTSMQQSSPMTNQLLSMKQYTITKPIYGEIHQVLPVDVHSV